MFHQTRFFTSELAVFMQTHAEALQNAAFLLGGRGALRRTQGLLEAFASQPALTRRMQRETIALHDLLTLQNVHDGDRDEAYCFAMLSPESPHVEEICLLADGLEDAMTSAGFASNWRTEAPDGLSEHGRSEDWQ